MRRTFTIAGAIIAATLLIFTFFKPLEAPGLEGLPGGDIAGAMKRGEYSTPPTLQASDDTLITTPWVGEIVHAWQPAPVRVFCIDSYATWPYFMFIRHIREITPPTTCAGPTPYLIQADTCPPSVNPPTPANFVLIQCGATKFRKYNRQAPTSGATIAPTIGA